jgi:hypothetical protein
MFTTILASAENSSETNSLRPKAKNFTTNFYGDDVPVWEEGTVWTYEINNIDFTFDETEGRYVDIHIKSGDLKLKVMGNVGLSYYTKLIASDLDIDLDINFDPGEDKNPIVFSFELSDLSFEGDIYFDRADLGIRQIDAKLMIDLDLKSLPIDLSMLPPLLLNLIPSIPITISIEAIFDTHYTLIDFPINTGKTWGLPSANITLNVEVSSIWLRLAYILNNIAGIFGMEFLPPAVADLLPDIGISTEIEIPEVPEEIDGDHVFKCVDLGNINVGAGNYNAYDISIVDEIANIYYSPEVGNLIKVTGNFNDILPFVQNINLELIKIGKETNDYID